MSKKRHKRTKTNVEIAEIFGCSVEHVRAWCRKGMPYSSPKRRGRGRRSLFNAEEVQAWLEEKGLRLPGEQQGSGPGRKSRDRVEIGQAVAVDRQRDAAPSHADDEEPQGSLAEQLTVARVKEAQAKAELRHLELLRVRGELVSREEARAEIRARIEATKSTLEAVPPRYAHRLIGLSEREAYLQLVQITNDVLALFAGTYQEEGDHAHDARPDT